MSVTIIPLYDRVLCKRVEAQTHTTEAGLFIPEAARERPQEAVVIEVGVGKRDDIGQFHKPLVSVGDRILIGKYSGAEIKVGAEDFLILREDEVLGIVRSTEEP